MKARSINGLGVAGAAMVTFMALVAVFAPLLAPYSGTERAGRPFLRPSSTHLLGTDDFGHDLFSQLLFGARGSLSIGLSAAAMALVVGFAVALIAGYFRGATESILMRIVDLMIAFPFFVLVIVLSAFFGQGTLTTIIVIGAVIWARPARVLRSQVIRIRELEHVTVASAMGARPPRIILRHILPRVAPLAAVQFVRAANVAVLTEASLSFLGLGDPDRVSWGTTLFFAQVRSAFLTDAWVWWILPPGVALTLVIVGFAYMGQAVDEWADPRLRNTGRRPLSVSRSAALAEPVSDADPVFSVDGISVEYQAQGHPVRAVTDVSVTIGRGQVTGLVGESGSGKSTLVMAALGLLRSPGRITGGTVSLNGRSVGRPIRVGMAALRGREIALVPQNAMNALNPAYTILHQVAESAALTRSEEAADVRAREVLEMVGIRADRHRSFPHELSGGMRQRVLIAMALANEPTVLIADEPVSGLDVVTQAQILDLLLDLRDRLGVGILLVSHDLPLVARVADEIVVLYAGSVVERGPAASVLAGADHPYTQLLAKAYPSLRGSNDELVAIPGTPPDLARLPPGCPFHPRCPLGVPECEDWTPTATVSADDRSVSCLLVEKR